MMFRVGQKVTMIRSWEPKADNGETFTRLGEVYTVRGHIMIDDNPGIYVAEIVNKPLHYARHGIIEMPFPAWNFRPVVERKTDISIFTQMLKPSKRGVDA